MCLFRIQIPKATMTYLTLYAHLKISSNMFEIQIPGSQSQKHRWYPKETVQQVI